jgi:hypothetical protein
MKIQDVTEYEIMYGFNVLIFFNKIFSFDLGKALFIFQLLLCLYN